jgi:hypothetical protein
MDKFFVFIRNYIWNLQQGSDRFDIFQARIWSYRGLANLSLIHVQQQQCWETDIGTDYVGTRLNCFLITNKSKIH